MQEPIHDLTAAMAAGDTAAVERFYRRYFDYLYRQAQRCTGRDEAYCLDVVQDAVLRVLRCITASDSERQLLAWLRLVVRTTALDMIRADTRRARRELAAVAQGAGPAPPESGDERAAWLAGQIAGLDPRLLHLIELRFQRKWSLRRIAGDLGLSLSAVDGRLRRMLRRLRQAAREDFHE